VRSRTKVLALVYIAFGSDNVPTCFAGDVVVWNDMLCDVDVEGFSFGMQNEDEEPALMGKIFHEASEDDVVKDGEPICILLHKRNEKEATSS